MDKTSGLARALFDQVLDGVKQSSSQRVEGALRSELQVLNKILVDLAGKLRWHGATIPDECSASAVPLVMDGLIKDLKSHLLLQIEARCAAEAKVCELQAEGLAVSVKRAHTEEPDDLMLFSPDPTARWWGQHTICVDFDDVFPGARQDAELSVADLRKLVRLDAFGFTRSPSPVQYRAEYMTRPDGQPLQAVGHDFCVWMDNSLGREPALRVRGAPRNRLILDALEMEMRAADGSKPSTDWELIPELVQQLPARLRGLIVAEVGPEHHTDVNNRCICVAPNGDQWELWHGNSIPHKSKMGESRHTEIQITPLHGRAEDLRCHSVFLPDSLMPAVRRVSSSK